MLFCNPCHFLDHYRLKENSRFQNGNQHTFIGFGGAEIIQLIQNSNTGDKSSAATATSLKALIPSDIELGIPKRLFISLFKYMIVYREWIKQQSNEKDQALANQKYADHLYDLKAREMDQRASELASAEADCRRAINMATKDMNLALTRERQAKEDAEKQQEQDDNFTEISNSVFGDMLTENPDVAQSAFGPHRVITDRWKGMSPAQLAEIRRIQKAQMDEKEVRTIYNLSNKLVIWVRLVNLGPSC